MKKNLIIIGVSLILVAAVTVAVVVGIGSGEKSSHAKKSVLKFSELIDSLCAVTDHKKTCNDTLSQEADYGKATPTDIIKIIISRLRQEVQSVASITGTYAKVAMVPSQIAALQDCQDLLKSADDNLASSLHMVSAGLQFLIDHEDSLKSQLSAVISYQQSCKDGIKHPLVVAATRLRLQTVTELTSDALAMVTQIPEIINILGALDAGNPRKLLGLAEARDDGLAEARDDGLAEARHGGYPIWFSATARRLSEFHGKGLLKPNVVVAKDGSGQYRTISEAVVGYSENRNHRGTHVIYVKSGVYEENITLNIRRGRVIMYGDGPRKTIVTGRKNYRDHFTALRTATFSVRGKGFVARSIAFRNTAGPEGGQAVALQVQADMSAFFNCRIDGYEGTLHALAHRQFYRNCVISGTVDFIFGDSSSIIQNSVIVVKKPLENQQNTITASGRADDRQTTGFVIHNCRIAPEQELFPVRRSTETYLGRPWKRYSRTVIMESTLGDLIHRRGWLARNGTFAVDTLFYAEYANRGPGADTRGRVDWKGYKVITNRTEAQDYSLAPFIQGRGRDEWLKRSGIPFLPGLKF